MRMVRIELDGCGRWGAVIGEVVQVLGQDPDGAPGAAAFSASVPLEEAVLLAPVEPTKVVAVGLNYRDHAEELGMAIPEEPILFMKPASSVVGPGADIVMPSSSAQVDYEAELAVVIGKRCRNVAADQAADYILGYTCGNDVTARDLQKKDGQWTRAKSFDTFCPIGPWIETELDPSDVAVEALVNGDVKQSSRTGQMIFGVPTLVEFISHVMTLLPGDVILTGTPPGVGPVADGDEVTIRVEGVGELANPVRREQGSA